MTDDTKVVLDSIAYLEKLDKDEWLREEIDRVRAIDEAGDHYTAEALSRALPAPTIVIADDASNRCCRRCGEYLSSSSFYCSKCGQKIDWRG